MTDEDDFTHYFNACSRLTAENERLKMELRAEKQDHGAVVAGLQGELDLWKQRTKMGAEIIEECVVNIEKLIEAKKRLEDAIASYKSPVKTLLAAKAEIERLRSDELNTRLYVQSVEVKNNDLEAALRGMLDEWERLSRYGSPMAKAANERVNAARRALCESHKGGA
jgi:chromosome segregation ATPase